MQAVIGSGVMKDGYRSGCLVNPSLEMFGDRWSLLILRDMIFGSKRRVRTLLRSEETISPNILADRLKSLVDTGMITRRGDPGHRLPNCAKPRLARRFAPC